MATPASPVIVDIGPAIIEPSTDPADPSTPGILAPPETTDWRLVAVTGVALVGSVALFLAVLRKPRRSRQASRRRYA